MSLATSVIPFSATFGTVYFDFKCMADTGAYFQIDGGSANERIVAENNASLQLDARMTDNSTDQWGVSGITNSIVVVDSSRHQGTLAWKLDDSAITTDNSAISADTVCTLPTMTTFHIGATIAITQTARLYRLVYVPRRVIDGDLPTWRYNF